MSWPNAAAMPMLDAHVAKQRREFEVEARVCVAGGESVAIFGASGAGKTTVLSCLAGLEQPDSGSVTLNDRRLFPAVVPLHQRNIGYLTQASLLFPHLSVAQNVCFGLPTASKETEAIREVRERFNLTSLWHAPATSISGGQAQRVALARMLARRPALVLLDEPFSGLDRVIVRDLIATLKDWQREHQCPMIVVDHQENVLRKLCSRIYVMEHGRVVQEGSWNEIDLRPASATLSQLLAPL